MEDIVVHRFGRQGAHPKIYIQAGLHADEVAGTLVLERLVRLLEVDDRLGRIPGEVIVVPHCNPRGLGQFVLGRHLGRFDVQDGRNFNRGFPDLAEDVISTLERLDAKARTRERAVEIGQSLLRSYDAKGDGDRLRLHLMQLSWGAEMVIDVHSDMEAILHMYSSQTTWPGVKPLAERLDIAIVLLADVSAATPFDEAHGEAWRRIGLYLGEHGAPPSYPTCACTVELRGLADVDEGLTMRDAKAFHAFLADAGAAVSESRVMPQTDTIAPAELAAVDMVPSPCFGIIVPLKAPGSRVRKGDTLARIFDPAEKDARSGWTEIVSAVDGMLFARWHQRVIGKGMSICKIVAMQAPERGTTRLLD